MPAENIADRLPPAPHPMGYMEWCMTIDHLVAHPEEKALLVYLGTMPLAFPPVGNEEVFALDQNWYGWCDWLRQIYASLGGAEPLDNLPYSILEWLTVMAIKVEDDVMRDPWQYPEDRSWCWFWVMVHNLGLDRPGIHPTEVEQIVSCLLNRQFAPSGAGSICGHMPNARLDMRYVPFWNQMNQWAIQNYDWRVV